MCGLFGFFGAPKRMPSQDEARRSLGSVDHRGPDARGMYRSEEYGLVLGHTRLSIVDPLERSDQPFEQRHVVLAYNGEIYNFRQLRNELLAAGVELKTNGDTEVIAAGYCLWGTKIFDRLRGMFALALFDRRQQSLHLARDEFGIKPLVFLEQEGDLLFASELKALARQANLAVNPGVLCDLLTWGFQMEDASFYEGVCHLAPGSVLTVNKLGDGSLKQTLRRLWRPQDVYSQECSPLKDGELRDVVDRSVRAHLVADVPVGIALSGGLDSSIVASSIARYKPGAQAYTFTFSEGEDVEVEHAALLCRKLGLRHHIMRLNHEVPNDWLSSVAWHIEEPIANINALPTFALSRFIREQGCKVVLVGEGSDEVFGGYPWYAFALDADHDAGAVFDAYRKRRAQLPALRLLKESSRRIAVDRTRDQRAAFVSSVERAISPLHGFMSFDLATQLQYSQLLRVDRMYMAHAVEARVPFLFRPVAEASAALPCEGLVGKLPPAGRSEKIALAKAFANDLPSEILNRPKFGSRGTFNLWQTAIASHIESELERIRASQERRLAREVLADYLDWTAITTAALSSKTRFALALMVECVHSLITNRGAPCGYH